MVVANEPGETSSSVALFVIGWFEEFKKEQVLFEGKALFH